MFEHRHAFGERHGTTARKHLEIGPRLRCSFRPINDHGTRLGIRKGFDDGDIGERLRCVEVLPVAGREGLRVTKRELLARVCVRGHERSGQRIAPRADDGGDRGLQRLSRHARSGALVAHRR